MPGEKGVWLLERARKLRPNMIRVLVTAYADMDAAIAAVNSGAIYKYVTKPWDPPQLEQTLKRGLEFFMVRLERDQLLTEKMSVIRNMMIADRIVSLGLLAAGLSHHIRNSLVAVKTFLDLAPVKMAEEKSAMKGLRNPDFWKEYHQNVQSQIEKINGLLKDLWTASGTPSFHFTDKVFIHEAISAALKSFEDQFAARRIQVDNRIPDSLPALQADKPKFYRLFELLLKDELASLPAGSRVTLTAELQQKTAPSRRSWFESATTGRACRRKRCAWCLIRSSCAATRRPNTASTSWRVSLLFITTAGKLTPKASPVAAPRSRFACRSIPNAPRRRPANRNFSRKSSSTRNCGKN